MRAQNILVALLLSGSVFSTPSMASIYLECTGILSEKAMIEIDFENGRVKDETDRIYTFDGYQQDGSINTIKRMDDDYIEYIRVYRGQIMDRASINRKTGVIDQVTYLAWTGQNKKDRYSTGSCKKIDGNKF